MTTQNGGNEVCDFCKGKGKVWYGYGGYDFLYPCPKCGNHDKTPGSSKSRDFEEVAKELGI